LRKYHDRRVYNDDDTRKGPKIMSKYTLYIGFHDEEKTDKQERLWELNKSGQGIVYLFRAICEIINYLLNGACE